MTSTKLLVLALFVVGCQSWKLPAIPAGRRAQFYTQQSDGAYKFGYDSAEGLFQVQEADPANEVHGKFGADGGHLEYTAGVDGFLVRGHKKATSAGTRRYTPAHTNAAAVRLANHMLGKPVQDTPEVAEAKRQFEAAFKAAEDAAEAAPDVNIITDSQPIQSLSAPYQIPVQTARIQIPHLSYSNVRTAAFPAHTDTSAVRYATQHQLGKPVEDTPEVAEAKRKFAASFKAAADAAEAAPDVGIITGSARIEAPSVLYRTPVHTTRVQVPHLSYSSVVRPAVPSRTGAPGVRFATLEELSKPVEDTREVAEAKRKFQAAYNAAAAAAEAAPDVNIITDSKPAQPLALSYKVPAQVVRIQSHLPVSTRKYFTHTRTSPAVSVRFPTMQELRTPPKPVQDTPEVSEAKRQHEKAFKAAAAAAEAAPDVNIITGSRPVQTTSFSYQAPVNTYRVRVSQPGFTQAHTSPTVRFATLQELNTPPKPVQDTPEVAQAKQAFKAAYDEAAAAAEAAPDTGIITGSAPTVTTTYSYSAPQIRTSYIAPAAPAVFVAPRPVEDTAEVKAAKQAFKAAYDAAAAAAAAAPDVNIISHQSGSSVRASSSHRGGDSTITYTLDGGVMVMQADGHSSPAKFGYMFE